jgi:hypothetical protein
VSETIIAPQFPLRTRAFRNVPMSEASASAVVGAVYRSAGGGVRRVDGARAVLERAVEREVERVDDPLLPALGGRDPPFWAAELASGAVAVRTTNRS